MQAIKKIYWFVRLTREMDIKNGYWERTSGTINDLAEASEAIGRPASVAASTEWSKSTRCIRSIRISGGRESGVQEHAEDRQRRSSLGTRVPGDGAKLATVLIFAKI